MNPSLHISETGDVKILVRQVNYRKFSTKQFILYENKSRSVYTILTGTLNDSPLNLEDYAISTLENEYSIPTYPTYWTGIEDIRFITDASILMAIPECNPSGQPCIFRASLDTKVHSHRICSPNRIEKNWMPYTDQEGNAKVIYSVDPLTIKSIDTDDRQVIRPIPALQGYHGSTNGILFQKKRLFLVHCNRFLVDCNRERTFHRWLIYNPLTHEVEVTEPFVFFTHSHIEFTCSLASFKGRIFVSLGVNDNSAFILELDAAYIDSLPRVSQ